MGGGGGGECSLHNNRVAMALHDNFGVLTMNIVNSIARILIHDWYLAPDIDNY